MDDEPSFIRTSSGQDEVTTWRLRGKREEQPLDPRSSQERGIWKTVTFDLRSSLLQHKPTTRTADHMSSMVVWQPSLTRHVPWMALLSSLVAIGCATASIVVLETSDGDDIRNWTPAPNIYLAILSTFASICLTTAFKTGVVVMWWRHAIHGCTARSLSDLWSFGTSPLRAAQDLRNAYRLRSSHLAVAHLILLMTLAHGPLLQGAFTVVTRPQNMTISLQANISSELPGSYTATRSPRNSAISPSPPMLEVMQDYYSRTLMSSPVSSTCEGFCNASLVAAGLAVTDCNVTTSAVDYSDLSSTAGHGRSETINGTGLYVELLSEPGPDNEDRLSLTVAGTRMDNTCTGSFTNTRCYLHSAQVEYDVNIFREHVQFASQIHHPPVRSRANNTYQGSSSGYLTTLGGLLYAVQPLFTTSFTWYLDQDYNWQYISPTTFGLTYGSKPTEGGTDCPTSWVDPTNVILSSMNEILFRLSLHVANDKQLNLTQYPLDPGMQLSQPVEVRSPGSINVYHVVQWAMWVAVILLLLGVASVVSILWGWWHLGTRFSLDPIEISRAFGSPLLHGSSEERRSTLAGTKSERPSHEHESVRAGKLHSEAEPLLRYGEVMLEEDRIVSRQRSRVDRRRLALDLTDGSGGESGLQGSEEQRLQFGDVMQTWPPRTGGQYIR